MKYMDLFKTPIFVDQAKCQLEVDKWMEDNVLSGYDGCSTSPDSNVYSDYFPGAPKVDQEKFRKLYLDNITNLFNFIGIDTKRQWNMNTKFWYNITEQGGWQEQHDHISSPFPIQFSGIHFLKFNKEHHEATLFRNPQTDIIRAMMPTGDWSTLPPYFTGLTGQPPVEQGEILFFPSYLKHGFPVQKSSERRITIAFNIGIQE